MSDRAVSEVISYVLVFALITSAVGIVSVSGLATLQDTRNAEQINNAERAYDVLGDNLADIYQRDAPSRATELNLAGSTLSTGGNVTIEITVDDGGTPVTVSYRIRPLVFSGEENRQLVYEAGAVFRTNRDGGVRVQDPPFILENDRVLISVVGLNRPGIQSVSGSTALVRAKNENSTVEYENTISSVNSYNITVRNTQNTQQADLWGEYLSEQGGSSCSTNASAAGCDFSPTGSNGRFYVVYHDIFLSIDR